MDEPMGKIDIAIWLSLYLAAGFGPALYATKSAMRLDGFETWEEAKRIMSLALYVVFTFNWLLWPLSWTVYLPLLWLVRRFNTRKTQ